MQIQGGLLGGTGTINASVNSSGVLSVLGSSPRLMTITGNYSQTGSGALNIDLAGVDAGTSFDRIVVGGTASLAGTLNVVLTNGFYPATNAGFVFLTAATCTGTFGAVNYPSNDVGMQLTYSPTNATIQVINVRPALPIIANQTNDELVVFNLDAAATDADVPAQILTYTLTNSPPGATIHPSSGAISWTPTEAQGSLTTNITVVVTDNGMPNLTVLRTFGIVVNEINVAPVLTLPNEQSFNEETTFSATALAADSDIPINPLIFELVSGPPGLTILTNGAIAWTPTEAQGSNTYTVTVRVTDSNTNAVNAQQLSTTNSFLLTVTEVNLPPVLTVPANQVLMEETTLAASASSTDPDIPGNPLTFSLISPPAGMIISPTTGAITWTPSESQGPSTNLITVIVSDSNPQAINATSLSATNTFTVVVNEVNTAPALPSIMDQAINELRLLTITNTAADSDIPANPLSYELVNAPSGATIDVNGIVTWTPTEAQGPGVYLVTVRVTDSNTNAVNAQQLSTTKSFVLTVNEPGGVFAWGDNSVGQTAVPLALSNVVAVGAGYYHSLALKSNGTVAAWGPNADDGRTNVPAGLSSVAAVAAGGYHNLALKTDGTIIGWGHNLYGEATGSVNTNPPYGASGPVVLAGETLSNLVAVAAGGYHSLAISNGGIVVPWGAGMVYNPSAAVDYGQSIVPAGLNGVVAVAGGQLHSLALRSDGTVAAWGANGHGQTDVPGALSNVVAVAGGSEHSLALLNDGTVVAWGDNSYGQAVVPADLTNAVAVAAGFYHNLALKQDGTVTAWGDNTFGQTTVPPGLSNLVAVGGGVRHSLALQGNGSVVITVQPNSRRADPGDSIPFAVMAAGVPPLGYQWRFNGTNIPSATNSTYNLGNVQPGNTGNYSVLVSNSLGTVVSSNAVLTVGVLLTPSGFAGNGFQLRLTGLPGTYVLQASTNLANWNSIGTNSTATGVVVFTDPMTSTFKGRFYRAVRQ